MPESAKRYTGPNRPKKPQAKPDGTVRGTACQRGYGRRWREARRLYLLEYPLCAQCEKDGHTKEADCVDHIVPHRGNDELFWDIENWQSLCQRCHSLKTGQGL